MGTCPEDGRPLTTHSDGEQSCALCRGSLLPWDAIDDDLQALLNIESNPNSPAYAKTKSCPQCTRVMTPWRIGKVDGWLERCPDCDVLWVEQLDRRVLERQRFNRTASEVYHEMDAHEQEELKVGLMASTEGADDLDIYMSPVHQTLALLGMPVVVRNEGGRTPVATWALAALNVALFFVLDPTSWSYDTADGSLLTAFTSIFVHFGWMHLLGNMYFMLAFGDGVEQKLSRLGVLLLFTGAGTAATLLQAVSTGYDTLIGGASGGVAAIMGACVILQPRARVAIGIRLHIIQVPIVAFGIFEVGYQTFMMVSDVPGVAWLAHLGGLVMGVAVGVWVRTRPD